MGLLADGWTSTSTRLDNSYRKNRLQCDSESLENRNGVNIKSCMVGRGSIIFDEKQKLHRLLKVSLDESFERYGMISSSYKLS